MRAPLTRLAPALAGLWGFYLVRAQLETALEVARRLLVAGERGSDHSLLAEGHFTLEVTCLNLGRPGEAAEHRRKGLALCVPGAGVEHSLAYGRDPEVALRSFGAWALWTLGQPHAAVAECRAARERALRLGHRPSLAFALFFSAFVHPAGGAGPGPGPADPAPFERRRQGTRRAPCEVKVAVTSRLPSASRMFA